MRKPYILVIAAVVTLFSAVACTWPNGAKNATSSNPSGSLDSGEKGSASLAAGSSDLTDNFDAASCVRFISHINQEAFLYHMQAKLRSQPTAIETQTYLQPHFNARGLRTSPSTVQTCAKVIASFVSYPELLAFQKLPIESAGLQLEPRSKLAGILSKRYPIRSCSVAIESIASEQEFNQLISQQNHGLAELEMDQLLSNVQVADTNAHQREMSVRMCLSALRRIKTYENRTVFIKAPLEQQIKTIGQDSIPVMIAH